MIRRAGKLLIPALALAAGAASAQTDDARYRFVVTVGNQLSFIDDASITRNGDTRTFWVLNVFITLPGAPALRDVSYFRLQMQADCRQRTTRPGHLIGYGADGRVTDDFESDGEVRQVGPESSGGWLLDYACSGRLRPDASTLPAMPISRALEWAHRTRERDAAEAAAR